MSDSHAFALVATILGVMLAVNFVMLVTVHAVAGITPSLGG